MDLEKLFNEIIPWELDTKEPTSPIKVIKPREKEIDVDSIPSLEYPFLPIHYKYEALIDGVDLLYHITHSIKLIKWKYRNDTFDLSKLPEGIALSKIFGKNTVTIHDVDDILRQEVSNKPSEFGEIFRQTNIILTDCEKQLIAVEEEIKSLQKDVTENILGSPEDIKKRFTPQEVKLIIESLAATPVGADVQRLSLLREMEDTTNVQLYGIANQSTVQPDLLPILDGNSSLAYLEIETTAQETVDNLIQTLQEPDDGSLTDDLSSDTSGENKDTKIKRFLNWISSKVWDEYGIIKSQTVLLNSTGRALKDGEDPSAALPGTIPDFNFHINFNGSPISLKNILSSAATQSTSYSVNVLDSLAAEMTDIEWGLHGLEGDASSAIYTALDRINRTAKDLTQTIKNRDMYKPIYKALNEFKKNTWGKISELSDGAMATLWNYMPNMICMILWMLQHPCYQKHWGKLDKGPCQDLSAFIDLLKMICFAAALEFVKLKDILTMLKQMLLNILIGILMESLKAILDKYLAKILAMLRMLYDENTKACFPFECLPLEEILNAITEILQSIRDKILDLFKKLLAMLDDVNLEFEKISYQISIQGKWGRVIDLVADLQELCNALVDFMNLGPNGIMTDIIQGYFAGTNNAGEQLGVGQEQIPGQPGSLSANTKPTFDSVPADGKVGPETKKQREDQIVPTKDDMKTFMTSSLETLLISTRNNGIWANNKYIKPHFKYNACHCGDIDSDDLNLPDPEQPTHDALPIANPVIYDQTNRTIPNGDCQSRLNLAKQKLAELKTLLSDTELKYRPVTIG